MKEQIISFKNSRRNLKNLQEQPVIARLISNVVSGRITIDAKSILGMLSVNWQEELCVIYEAQNEKFDTVVQKYAVG